MNFPVMVSQNKSGMKAANVVAVEDTIGQNMRSPASWKASRRGKPSSIFRSAYSIITMALSTKTPTDRMRPKRIIILIVSPCIKNRKKAIRKLAGMAQPTNMAERHPSAAMQTIKTRITALMMEEDNSLRISLI